MAKVDKGIERAAVIHLMSRAFKTGQSASSFIQSMKAKGLAYRRTVMLADWRSVNEVVKKEGELRYVRRDYHPAERTLAAVEWDLSAEYMYKVKTTSRLRPDEPIEERFVNIMSNVPLTPREIEQEVTARWGEWERYAAEELVGLRVWTAYRRVAE